MSSTLWTDHKLMSARLNLRIDTCRQIGRLTIQQRLNTANLRTEAVQQQLAQALSDSLTPLVDNVEQMWSSSKSTVCDAAKSVLGTRKSSHRDWFDENDAEIQTVHRFQSHHAGRDSSQQSTLQRGTEQMPACHPASEKCPVD